MEVIEPRDKPMIWLIGLVFGPVVLMLWLGCGRLAFGYFLMQLIVIAAVVLPISSGLLTPPTSVDLLTLVGISILLTNIIGVVHGVMISETSLARPWFSRWYVAIVATIAVSWLASYAMREFFYQSFNAPSGSMIPGLMAGDYFFVSKTAYGYSRFS